MTRLEENKILIEKIQEEAECKPTGTYNEITAFQFGAIVSMLIDISRSLAILADKAESEET